MLKNIQYYAIQGTEIIRTFAGEIIDVCTLAADEIKTTDYGNKCFG